MSRKQRVDAVSPPRSYPLPQQLVMMAPDSARVRQVSLLSKHHRTVCRCHLASSSCVIHATDTGTKGGRQ